MARDVSGIRTARMAMVSAVGCENWAMGTDSSKRDSHFTETSRRYPGIPGSLWAPSDSHGRHDDQRRKLSSMVIGTTYVAVVSTVGCEGGQVALSAWPAWRWLPRSAMNLAKDGCRHHTRGGCFDSRRCLATCRVSAPRWWPLSLRSDVTLVRYGWRHGGRA